MEIIGVTYMELTFSFDFAFLESEKKNNVIWALKVCRNMLKDRENMSKVFVTNCDTTLMNLIAKVFSTLYALLCRYHITKQCEK